MNKCNKFSHAVMFSLVCTLSVFGQCVFAGENRHQTEKKNKICFRSVIPCPPYGDVRVCKEGVRTSKVWRQIWLTIYTIYIYSPWEVWQIWKAQRENATLLNNSLNKSALTVATVQSVGFNFNFNESFHFFCNLLLVLFYVYIVDIEFLLSCSLFSYFSTSTSTIQKSRDVAQLTNWNKLKFA